MVLAQPESKPSAPGQAEQVDSPRVTEELARFERLRRQLGGEIRQTLSDIESLVEQPQDSGRWEVLSDQDGTRVVNNPFAVPSAKPGLNERVFRDRIKQLLIEPPADEPETAATPPRSNHWPVASRQQQQPQFRYGPGSGAGQPALNPQVGVRYLGSQQLLNEQLPAANNNGDANRSAGGGFFAGTVPNGLPTIPNGIAARNPVMNAGNVPHGMANGQWPQQVAMVPFGHPQAGYPAPPTHWAQPTSPSQNAAVELEAVSQLLRDTARRLDEMAADLEDSRCFAAADQMREAAEEVRQKAREMVR